MGSEPSQTSTIISLPHPKLQTVELSSNREQTIVSMFVPNEELLHSWERACEQVKKLDNDALLLPELWKWDRKDLCGNACVLKANYEGCLLVLAEEIRQRGEVSKYFEERELWYLLYCLVTASMTFRQLDSKIGDVRPLNIFINDNTGVVRVGNRYSWPVEPTNYEKAIFNNQTTYLAPEEVKQARQGRVHTQVDKYAAESFSIGLTMLGTALLRDFSQLYKKKGFSFEGLIQGKKDFMNVKISEGQLYDHTYSEVLKMVIIALCESNQVERTTAEEIYHWLHPHEMELLNLKPFSCNYPPLRKYSTDVLGPLTQPTPIKPKLETYSSLPFPTSLSLDSTSKQPRISSLDFMPDPSPYNPEKSKSLLERIDEQLKRSKQQYY